MEPGTILVLLLAVFMEDAFLFSAPGAGELCIVDSECHELFSVSPAEGERITHPVLSEPDLIYLSSADGLMSFDICTGEKVVLDTGTGAPWISSDGYLWYTKDGELYLNGENAGVQISAFHVSVENGTAVFTDTEDNIHILDLQTRAEEIITGYRFYAPEITPAGDVFSPTLTGEIIFVPYSGEVSVAATGEQPCWSSEHQGLFYCVSTDDGHVITGADIWFVRPGEEPVQVTSTADLMETKPFYSSGRLWYIESATQLPGQVGCHDL